jgi:hypothetical protein
VVITLGGKRMSDKKRKNEFKVGRDAKTGEFIRVEDAKRRPSTTIVQTIKKPTARTTKRK